MIALWIIPGVGLKFLIVARTESTGLAFTLTVKKQKKDVEGNQRYIKLKSALRSW